MTQVKQDFLRWKHEYLTLRYPSVSCELSECYTDMFYLFTLCVVVEIEKKFSVVFSGM